MIGSAWDTAIFRSNVRRHVIIEQAGEDRQTNNKSGGTSNEEDKKRAHICACDGDRDGV